MYIRLVIFAALFSLSGYTLAVPNCGGKASSHADERACWIKAAEKSNARVHSAEESLRKRIKSWDEDANCVETTLALFDESTRRFSRHRQSQCEFEASIAAGGNGAGDMRLSCQIGLDETYLRWLHEQFTRFSNP